MELHLIVDERVKIPFFKSLKLSLKSLISTFFYYFDLNYMCLTLYSLMSARYSECHGCSPKKTKLITCFIHIVTSYYCWPYQQVIWKSHNFHPLTCWTFSEEKWFLAISKSMRFLNLLIHFHYWQICFNRCQDNTHRIIFDCLFIRIKFCQL